MYNQTIINNIINGLIDLSDEEVMREFKLSKKYGIAHSQISRILTYKRWA